MAVGKAPRLILTSLTALCMVALAGCGTATTGTGSGTQNAGTVPAAGTEAKSAAGKEIVIGAIVEASGPAASNGTSALNAFRLYEEQLNARGGINGSKVKLVVVDNESDQTKSLTAAKKLVEGDKAVAIVGPTTTPNSMAIAPYLDQAKVPIVTLGSSGALVNPVKPFMFKVIHNQTYAGQRIVDFLKARNIKTAAQVVQNDAFGQDSANEFQRLAAEAGIQITASEKMNLTDLDVKAQLTRIKATNPGAILAWVIPPASSRVAKNATELGISVPVIHASAAATKTFVDQAGGEAVEGQFIIAGNVVAASSLPDSSPNKAELIKFVTAYESKYNTPVNYVAAAAYDAMTLLEKALQKAGPDPVRVRDAFENLGEIKGLTGNFKITPQDHQGLSKDAMTVIQVKQGKFAVVDK